MSDRVFNLFKLGMGRFPAVNIDVHIESLVTTCKHYFSKGDAFLYIEGQDGAVRETNAIYISDLEDTAETLSLLLVRGDPGRPLPSFVNIKRRVVKEVATDEPDDVPGASCHLVISKRTIAGGKDQGRHRAAMERTRGVSRALARDFLTTLMKRYAEEFPDKYVAEKTRKKKSDKPEHIQYRPTVAFHPQENGSLKHDLEEGRIGGFKLSRGSTKFEGEATEATVQRLDVQLLARIVPTADFGRVRALVDHIRQEFEKIEFEALNLELVDEAGQPLSSTKAVSVDSFGEGDMRYVKTVPIVGLDAKISECYPEFYPPILAAGKDALAKKEHWA